MLLQLKNKQSAKHKEYKKSLENLFYYKKPKKHKPSLIELALVGCYIVCSIQFFTVSYAHLQIDAKLNQIKENDKKFFENSKKNEQQLNQLFKNNNYQESYTVIENLLTSKKVTDNSIGLNLILTTYLQNEKIPEKFKNNLDNLLKNYNLLSQAQIEEKANEYNVCFNYDILCKKYVDKPNAEWINQYYKTYNKKSSILKYNAQHLEEYKKWRNLSLRNMINSPMPYEVIQN